MKNCILFINSQNNNIIEYNIIKCIFSQNRPIAENVLPKCIKYIQMSILTIKIFRYS